MTNVSKQAGRELLTHTGKISHETALQKSSGD
jgi:hypothetical protein